MHFHQKIKLFVLSLVLLSSATVVLAETEGQMARNAEKLFIAKQYTAAAPIYAQLVSTHPKNYKYNYYYGICLIITAKDKNDALPYLEMALKNTKTPEDIYYYMGRAYHLTYHFDQAARSFTEFGKIIGSKNGQRWQTPQLIGVVNNAIQILDTTKNSLIMETAEVSSGDFYKNYHFDNPNGKLLSMPDQIIKNSKSQNENRPMIFLSANNRVMYYSAVSSETSSRDIYRVEKDLDNNWGAPKRVSTVVNTSQDELYPTCNADGRILYFSSRGHNSTGGFDVFKSYYNTVTKTFSVPENMGSPINSPDDDFCFVASAEEGTAYFTSQRASGPGVLTVFKMKYADTSEELPIAINGRFNCIGAPDLKEVKLKITKAGVTIAEIITDKNLGTYAMELPGAGTYTFTVDAKGYKTISQDVTFGKFKDNIFVQDIILSKDYRGIENLAVSSRRLSDSDLLDANRLASSGEKSENLGSGSFDAANAGKSSSNSNLTDNLTASTGSYPAAKIIAAANVKMPSMVQGIHYKVQIGAFRNNQLENVSKKLSSKVDADKMTHYQDAAWLRFYFGDEITYKSVKNLCSTLVAAGFSDAFVVAFEDQTRMELSKAIKLTDK